MKTCLWLAVVLLAFNTIALAETETDTGGPMALALAFVEAFNSGDREALRRIVADDASIIETFPPYYWTGAGARDRWLDDLAGRVEQADISDTSLQMGKVHAEGVDGLHGHISAAASLRFNRGGTEMVQFGSINFALRRVEAGWRIIAWSWSGKASRPAGVERFVDDPDRKYH